ncbi:hypothetical protein AX16_005731 [Volvariella volvacea WC 439]|nr:hypothetical protein AX16_005731 [Volvariella volvacea WC 439]
MPIGYIIVASAGNVGTVGGGIVICAVGFTGLQLLTQIVIADITTLEWRGLVSGGASLPFVINAFVGSDKLELEVGVWNYCDFGARHTLTLIGALLWAERKAQKLGIVEASLHAPHGRGGPESQRRSGALFNRMWDTARKLDLVGLVLLGASISLVFLPVTLTNNAWNQWKNLNSLELVVRQVVVTHELLFTNANHVSHNFRCSGRYYDAILAPYLVFGLAIRVTGVGMMIHSRGANSPDAEIVWAQILQGIGGGLATVTAQVGAQASVPHSDVAIVTAIVLLTAEIGGAIGSAIFAAIWTNRTPDKLAQYLSFLPEEQRQQLYGSIVIAAAQPRGDPIREGVIQAYDDVMSVMLIAATANAVIPLVLSLFMPNWYLGDQQNVVENIDLARQRVDEGNEGLGDEKYD